MAIAPDPTWQDQPSARPVLGAVTSALDGLSASTPERLWALSDGEVTEAFTPLPVSGRPHQGRGLETGRQR